MKNQIFKFLIILLLGLTSLNGFGQTRLKIADVMNALADLDIESTLDYTPINKTAFYTYQSRTGKTVLYFAKIDIQNTITKKITSEYMCFAWTRFVNYQKMKEMTKNFDNPDYYKKVSQNVYIHIWTNERYTIEKINYNRYSIDCIDGNLFSLNLRI